MTDERQPDDERSAFAAEHALRLLTGKEGQTARERAAADPDFAHEVARWRGRVAALGDEVAAIDPPRDLLPRIERSISGSASDSNVIQLRRRLNVWRGAAAGMTALAATLAGVLVLEPPSVAPVAQHTRRSPMVAMLANDQNQMKVVASWDPAGRRLVLAIAGDMPADTAHAHELWVIPAGGKARSLGVMGGEKQSHMQLADAIAELMRSGATIAISVEPPGGSPTGAPTGPVIASGALTRA